MTTGEKLKAAMEAAGTDEYRLARLMYINPIVIINYVNGKKIPDVADRAALEHHLKLPKGALKGDENHAGDDAANHADRGAAI